MIKTLFLDADDTVFDFAKAQRAALFSAFESLGYPIDENIYKIYDQINISYWKKLERGETSKEKLVFDRFTDLFAITGMSGDEIRAEEAYQSRLGTYAFWWEGAKEGMAYLSQKYDIFILTNGHGDTQVSRVRRSGLNAYIKGLFVSELVGYAKPQKEYYDYCFARSGADKATTVCVGDSLTSDIKGGRDYGLKTLWCNFKGEKETGAEADWIAHDWKELTTIL